MQMKYYLAKMNLRDKHVIEITKAEFMGILDARKNLVHALELESCFHIAVDNYIALEEAILGLAARHAAFSAGPRTDSFAQQLDVTRHIMNYLSSAKSYACYLQTKGSVLLGSAPAMTNLTTTLTRDNFAYIFLDALRDYAQHEGIPVTGFTVHNNYDHGDKGEVALCSVSPTFIAKNMPAGRRKLDKATKTRIESLKEPLDLRPFVREHFECIASVHDAVRKAIAPRCIRWEVTLNDAIEKYRAVASLVGKGDVIGLHAIRTDESLHPCEHERVAMFTGMVDRRRTLEARNQIHTNVSKRFASGAIRK